MKKKTWTSKWDEHRQNWPGRLAWLEARISDGTATPKELAERNRLLVAQETGLVVIEVNE